MSRKADANLIIQDVQRVAIEMGKVPFRDEYEAWPTAAFTKHTIIAAFGSWTTMLQASGLQYAAKGKRDKQEIRKEVHQHLVKEVEALRARPQLPPLLVKHALILGDQHKPYHHIDSIPFLLAVKAKYESLGRPFDLTVDIGDGEDFHGINFHDHDPDLLSPGHEMEAVIAAKQPLYQAFPNMQVMESNHGSMVFRKGKHHGLPRHVLKSYREILQAPEGWQWHHELIVQMTNGSHWLFCHSYGGNVLQVSQKRGLSVVQGHHHSKFSIQAWANYNGLHFACQTGCLIDDASMAFAYNKTTVDRPVMGSLRIEDGIPYLLPMFLDKNGRWNKVVP
ncbi:MAG: homing endonuclease associated repeat-containing protein [Bdellovibrionota bacterium]